MRAWKSTAAVGVVVLMVAAACAGTADEQTSTSDAPTPTSEMEEDAPGSAPAAPDTTDPASPPAAAGSYPVLTTEGISGPDIDEITVWSPDAEGEWPVVLLLAGWSETAAHYRLVAERLAGEGVVVFAPDYRARDIDTDVRNPYRDAECAYRHMRTAAADFGGDLTQPVTVVGHSLGGIVGLGLVLNEEAFLPEGPFDRCPSADEVPRPDRLVTLSSCYYESGIDGTRFPFDPVAYGWSNVDADIQLVVGGDDDVCPAWQPQDARDALVADGFEDVEVTVIDGADHFDVMFTRWEGDQWFEPDTKWFDVPGAPGGVAAVEAMLDSIMKPAAPASDESVDVVVVEAANEQVEDVTVYTPVEDGTWPTVVLFPGYDQPRSTLDPFARQLAVEGLAVATTDYDTSRLLSGGYECAQQFATLAAWDHGGDPNGVIVTGGHFFGASMASMASMFEPFIPFGKSEPIDCGLEGQDDIRPTDLVVGLSGSWFPNECDLPPETNELSDGLPAYVLEYDGNPGVPFIIAHGTDNPICPAAQAAAATAELEAGGHPTRYVELDGAGFAEGILFVESDDEWPQVTANPDSESSQTIVDAIVAAVDALSA